MAKHPNARGRRRDDDAPDDAFVAGLLQFSTWAKQNARSLTIGALVLAGVIAVWLWYDYSQDAARAQAAVRLSQIRQTVASGNRALAIRDLGDFVDRASGTPAGAAGSCLGGFT